MKNTKKRTLEETKKQLQSIKDRGEKSLKMLTSKTNKEDGFKNV